MTSGPESGAASKTPPVELVAALLQATEGRRDATDQMMWQVPVLSLTAQSFLLTITLSEGPRAGRVIAATLAGVAALAAIQLLLKHRYHEMTLSRALERLERENGLPELHGSPSTVRDWAWDGKHGWDVVNGPWTLLKTVRRWLIEYSSATVWVATLAIFAVTDVASALVVGLLGL